MVDPYTPAIDEMLMMEPPPGCSIILRPAHLQPKNVPLRLMPTTVFQPLAEMSSTLARNEAPALLTMTSRRPISFTVRSTRSLTWSSCRTSSATQKERRPIFWISAATGSRFSILRLAITTSAPARANSIAMDLPIPTPPPVTMATLFSIEKGDAAMARVSSRLSRRVVSPAPRRREGRVRGGAQERARTRGLYPVARRRALEGDRSSRDRVLEGEVGRVQAEPPHRAPRPAVGEVADDRAAGLGELYTDLMAAPGAQAQLEQRTLPAPADDAVVRDREPPGGRRSHPQHAVLGQPALERALRARWPAVDQRPVPALHAARLELSLERALHRLALGEHQQSRRLAIQPVDDERPLPLFREIVPKQAIGGALALPLGGDGEQAGRLDHHQERVVLVDEGQLAGEGRATSRAQPDQGVGADRQAPVAARAAVDGHAPALEPLLHAPAGGLRIERAEPFREGHSPRRTLSGRRPRSRRVPRSPTSSARPGAESTPASSAPGAHRAGRSKAQRITAQASAAASALPARPAAAPRRTYSTAKTRATKPGVAPTTFRITDW